MLITQGNLKPNALQGEVVVVTGAGRGIGYEAARALAWLGAKVVVAEVNENNGRIAADLINKDFGEDKALFVKTDVSSEEEVANLKKAVLKQWGKVDAVLNNATVFPMGPVKDTPIDRWDFSYHVNLRGPVLLARAFLPDMLKRKHGVFVCVSSSGAAPYMGAYEVFKTAQVELANTIAAEVEATGVYAFTIGPGIVRTPGFTEGGAQAASYMGISVEQLMEMNKKFELTSEAAGVGFAGAVALASQYHGQETSSIQVLRAMGIDVGMEEETKAQPPKADNKRLVELSRPVVETYVREAEGWKSRNIFQRQWVYRDFKKNTGMSVDDMLNAIQGLEVNVAVGAPTARFFEPLKKLADYYEHQKDLLKSFERSAEVLEKNTAIINGWISDINALLEELGSPAASS